MWWVEGAGRPVAAGCWVLGSHRAGKEGAVVDKGKTVDCGRTSGEEAVEPISGNTRCGGQTSAQPAKGLIRSSLWSDLSVPSVSEAPEVGED